MILKTRDSPFFCNRSRNEYRAPACTYAYIHSGIPYSLQQQQQQTLLLHFLLSKEEEEMEGMADLQVRLRQFSSGRYLNPFSSITYLPYFLSASSTLR